MGRGPTVANKKEASAKAKGKIFSIHSKLISIAAESGSDPSINHLLADAIYTAKKAGVTADVIERAIKRGAGLDKDAKKVEEVIYEGYLPGGVAVIIRALTDNRNRTAPNLRHIFSSCGGNMGETGSVSNYLFDFVGKIQLTSPEDKEALEGAIMDTQATDYVIVDEEVTVFTSRADLMSTKSSLTNAGYTIESTELTYIPKNYIEITTLEQTLQIYKFLDECDEDEDIETVWNNADISDTLWQQAREKIESGRFRT